MKSVQADDGGRADDRVFRNMAWTLAAFCLGQAIQIANGTLRPAAILWLSAAIVLCGCGVLVGGGARLNQYARIAWPYLIASAIVTQYVQLMLVPPMSYIRWNLPQVRQSFHAMIAAAALLALCALVIPRRFRLLVFALVLAAHIGTAFYLLKQSYLPYIDLVPLHRESSRALLHGRNPYSTRIPDIYTPRYFLYTPEQTRNGWLTYGYIYSPINIILALPGYMLGDFRYSQLAAVAGSAWLLACSGPQGVAAALLFLSLPRIFYVVEMGWTEPFALMLLCVAVVLARRRGPGATAAGMGLFMAAKQHLIGLFPLALLLHPPPRARSRLVRWAALACVVWAGTYLPFLIWDPHAFYRSLIGVQLGNIFRPDALNYAALMAIHGLTPPPQSFAFVLFALGLTICLWKAPRTPAGFAASSALCLLLLFSFAKQAFCNYFYLIFGALCCALAASDLSPFDQPGWQWWRERCRAKKDADSTQNAS